MRPQHKFLILFTTTLALATAPFAAAATRPVHAQHAMVVTVHQLASQVGVEIMQAGGMPWTQR
jgi:gamma-glutamyltranspeptidase